MTYTPITDEDEVREAYEWMRNAFQANADQEVNRAGCLGYQHDHFNLWGAFDPMEKENRYWIAFGNMNSSKIVFEANPPKSGTDGRQGEGLFVKDDKGNRYLTHSGNFNLREGHEAARGRSRETFRKFTDSDRCWVSVSGKEDKRYLITELDVEASTLFEKIRSVVDTVYNFKSEYSQSKSTGAAELNNGGDVQHNQSLNTILYGPPGTGKTWNTVNHAVAIIKNQPVETLLDNEEREVIKKRFDDELANDKGQIDMVTFHQNYSYEDFIEGIRPVLVDRQQTEENEGQEDTSNLEYQLSDGIFKKIAKRAKKNQKQNYVLIIDEINRGNIAKIFGELITLIEPSKRLKMEDKATAILPYSKKSFGVPNNLYIIGTMNTADRSIALLDTALRRRFDFIEIMPDPNHPEISDDIEGVNCQKLLEKINERIRVLHDRDHQIGHTYFIGVKKMASLAKTFQNQIIPLLQEYFYDNWEKIDLVLNKNGFIKSSDVDKSLFKSSDLVDAGRKIYELLPAEKNEKEDKWRSPDNYKKIYETGDQPSQDGQDNQSE